jgi:predicted small lipoprotein YifL
MKNLFKTLMLGLVVTSFTACYSGTPKGKLDSVAANPSDTGTSTTVDTLPKTVDTAKTDTIKK